VPPDADTVTVDVPPLQRIGVADEKATRSGGWLMEMDATAEQLFASVTRNEYVPALRMNVPVPIYAPVPPLADTVTVVVPPLQPIAGAVAVAVRSGGLVRLIVAVAVHPLVSVTRNEYVPAERVNVPVPEYGVVPPEADTVTVVVPPLQRIGGAEADAVRSGGLTMLMVAVAVQPRVSVTRNEYVPAERVNVPVPVYGVVPPEADTVTVVVPPLQGMTGAVAVAVRSGGLMMLIVAVAEQLFASVTRNEYVPALRVKVPVPT